MRLWGPWRASLITSALFGLWHIEPTLHTMRDNRAVAGAAASTGGQVLVVLGAIAVTFVAGLIFCWLRLRSRSLIAPVIAHAATNGLALTVAWFAVHWGHVGGSLVGRDDLPQVGQLRSRDAGRLHDGVEAVDVLAGVLVAVPGRDAGGERQVGGDLPEGHEGQPEHAPEHVLARGLTDPVGLAEDK